MSDCLFHKAPGGCKLLCWASRLDGLGEVAGVVLELGKVSGRGLLVLQCPQDGHAWIPD